MNTDKLTDFIALGTSSDVDLLLSTSPTSRADLDIVSAGASPETVGIGRTLTYTGDVTANETDPILANNTATQTPTVVPIFTLTLVKTANGAGTVTPADGGISWGADCSTTYLSGPVVNAGETPDANSVFAGWSGACTGTGACAVTMSADMTLTAAFVSAVKLCVALAGTGLYGDPRQICYH